MQPVTYPKLFCIASYDTKLILKGTRAFSFGERDGKLFGCRCNTQQGTRAMISAAACLNYVENGAFDFAKPDREPTPPMVGYQNVQPQQTAASLPAGSFGALTSRPIVP